MSSPGDVITSVARKHEHHGDVLCSAEDLAQDIEEGLLRRGIDSARAGFSNAEWVCIDRVRAVRGAARADKERKCPEDESRARWSREQPGQWVDRWRKGKDGEPKDMIEDGWRHPALTVEEAVIEHEERRVLPPDVLEAIRNARLSPEETRLIEGFMRTGTWKAAAEGSGVLPRYAHNVGTTACRVIRAQWTRIQQRNFEERERKRRGNGRT